MVTCFAGDIGIPCVKFLNFRSQWQGVTEANLEKIFNLLKALWPVAVMIDEADAFLGNRDASAATRAPRSRVFALHRRRSWATREYRGKIIWFLLTCRPDLLPDRPEAAGPRRGAPRALLPADATRSGTSCSG